MSVRDDLEAELKADDLRERPRPTCKTCTWLRSLDEENRGAWQELIMDESYTVAQLIRAIIGRRQGGMGATAFRGHRRKGHRV